MPLIKNIAASNVIKDALVLDLSDLAHQAEAILERAREQARELIRNAEIESNQMRGRAREEGYALGFKEGLEEGRTSGAADGRHETIEEMRPRLDDLLNGWQASLESLAARRDELVRDAHADLLMLAVNLASRITHRTIDTHPDAVLDQVRAAMELMLHQTDLVIRVHPDDHALISEALPGIIEITARCEHASVREDEAVERGGCVLVTPHGRIDASLETQLARAAETLVPNNRFVEATADPTTEDEPE